MSAIVEIEKRLRNFPELRYKISESTITIEPPSRGGFSLSLIETGSQWVVQFDGWHEHFDSETDALDCFAFGLTDECRLQITYRGSKPCKWTLQSKSGSGWVSDSTTGLLVFPFWLRKRVEYLQNNIISEESK